MKPAPEDLTADAATTGTVAVLLVMAVAAAETGVVAVLRAAPVAAATAAEAALAIETPAGVTAAAVTAQSPAVVTNAALAAADGGLTDSRQLEGDLPCHSLPQLKQLVRHHQDVALAEHPNPPSPLSVQMV